AEGAVNGALDDPHFTGQVTVSNGEVQGYGFERFSGKIDATRREIKGTRLAISHGAMTVAGSADVIAREGKFDDPAVTGQFDVRNAVLADLLKEAGSTMAVTGTGSANVRLAGTARRPELDVT